MMSYLLNPQPNRTPSPTDIHRFADPYTPYTPYRGSPQSASRLPWEILNEHGVDVRFGGGGRVPYTGGQTNPTAPTNAGVRPPWRPGTPPQNPSGGAGQPGGPFGPGSGTATPGPVTSQQAQPGGANYNTTITPQGVYTPEMTAQAGNQLIATQRQQADPRWLMKRFAGSGRSQDAGIASVATPYLAQSQLLGQRGLADLLLGDHLANQENLLAGEVARESEGLGLGNLLARLQETEQSYFTPQRSQLLNLLLGMVG